MPDYSTGLVTFYLSDNAVPLASLNGYAYVSTVVSLQTLTKIVCLSWALLVFVVTTVVFIKKYGREYNLQKVTGYSDDYEMPNNLSMYIGNQNDVLATAALLQKAAKTNRNTGAFG